SLRSAPTATPRPGRHRARRRARSRRPGPAPEPSPGLRPGSLTSPVPRSRSRARTPRFRESARAGSSPPPSRPPRTAAAAGAPRRAARARGAAARPGSARPERQAHRVPFLVEGHLVHEAPQHEQTPTVLALEALGERGIGNAGGIEPVALVGHVQPHGVARYLDPYAHEAPRVSMVAVRNGIGEGFREGGAEVEADAAGGEGTAGQLVREQLHRWADVLEVARHVERQLHLGLASRRPPANLEGLRGLRGLRRGHGLKSGERLLWRARDREERVQLGQLEQRLEIFVQAAEPEVSTLLADLLRERHQDAKAGRIDIAGLGEVDDELLATGFERVEHFLLQLLTVADDQLPVHPDHHHAVLVLLETEAHDRSPA